MLPSKNICHDINPNKIRHTFFATSVTSFHKVNKTCDWTEEDKKVLLLALQTHGNSIADIAKDLPHKSINDIKYVINFYKSAAAAERHEEMISQWLQIVKYLEGKSLDKSTGMSLVSRALKYIAIFEKNSDSDVDLNEAMMFVSRVCDGQGVAELSDATGNYVLQVLKGLARNLKTQDITKYNTNSEEYFNNLPKIDEIMGSDYFINPLRVPKKMLRLTIADKNRSDILFQ